MIFFRFCFEIFGKFFGNFLGGFFVGFFGRIFLRGILFGEFFVKLVCQDFISIKKEGGGQEI